MLAQSSSAVGGRGAVDPTALTRNAQVVATSQPDIKTFGSASIVEMADLTTSSGRQRASDDAPDEGSSSSPTAPHALGGARLHYDSDDDDPLGGNSPSLTGLLAKPRAPQHSSSHHQRLDSAAAAELEDGTASARRRRRSLRRFTSGFSHPSPVRGWLDRNTGFLLIVAAQLGFATMNALVALLHLASPEGDEEVPTWEIIWIRMLITGLACVGYMYLTGVEDPVWGPAGVRQLLAIRGFSGFFGLFGIYYSLRYLSLSDAEVLTFLAPILSGLLAVPLLGEAYSVLEGVTGVASLLGVVLIAKPEAIFGSYSQHPTETSTPVDSVPSDPLADVTPKERLLAVGVSLIGVLGQSGAYLTIRKIGSRANALHSISWFSAWCVIVSTAYAVIARSPPVIPSSPTFIVLLFAIGIMGYLGQWLLTMGLQREKVGRGTAAIYLNIVFAIALQKICFGTTPDIWSLLGSTIIVGGALLVALKKAHAKQTASSSASGTVDREDGGTRADKEGKIEQSAATSTYTGLRATPEAAVASTSVAETSLP